MKIKFSRKLKQVGTALLVALVLAGILCVMVTGYLSVAEHQNFLTARSQAWNMAIVVTEAGIEEGLEHLNVYTTTNLSADGWSYDGRWYSHSNGLPNGDWYKVSITITNPAQPILICNSTVASTTFLAQKQSPFMFATVNQSPQTATPTVHRAVKVVASKGNLFTAAVVVKTDIDLKGNGVSSDSFDSTNPAKSTNGKYDANKYSGDRGDIASNGGMTNSVGVQNANIYGTLHTGAGLTPSIGPNGAVGTHAWQAGNSGFQPGYWLQDANFTFPDTTLPDTSSGYLTPPGPFTNVSPIYTYVTNAINGTNVYPNPVPWSGVATNYGYSSNTIYSSPPSPLATNVLAWSTPSTNYPSTTQPVTTNTAAATTASYPAAGTYISGSVTTNLTTTNSASASIYPAAGTYVGLVQTNTTSTTNSSYPAAGTYVGAVTTNTTSQTSSSYPSAGSYIGAITTNFTQQTSGSYPAAGTFFPPVTTNTTAQHTQTYPSPGTYLGGITTNIVSTGPPSGRGTWYNYNQITGYTYNTINNYTFNAFAGYVYSKVSGYTWNVVSGYTWNYYAYTYPTTSRYTYPNNTYTYNTFQTNTSYTTNVYDFVLHGDTKYVSSGLSGKKVFIEGANVTLVLPNGMDGSEGFTWNTGANLLVYSGGSSVGIAGNGYINPNGQAASLIIYAAPTVTSFTLAGNGQFTGVLVAPSADVALKGGGSSDEDFCGSLMCNSLRMNGHFHFHYDESLNTQPSNARFLIASWDEIDPANTP